MDYTPNIDAQGMRRPMGPVDQPNWNGGPKLIHNPQVMNNQTVGQPNLANAMANQRPIIPIRGRIVTSEQDIVPAEIPMDGRICLFMTEDCKKVIAKQWNSNGVLQSIIYSISSNEQAQSECQNGDNTGELKAQLDRIENMLNRQGHQNKSRFRRTRRMISQCIQQMAMKILKENPNIANNPNAQSMINVIQSGDEKKGQEIAENICKSMGVSKEDAIRQAEQFFHVK